MTYLRSFRHKPDPRQATYVKLAGSIESQLREAYGKRHDQGRVNQAGLAKLLGVGRSVIHRRLNGSSNLTLKSVADLVWGTGHAIEVKIYDPEERADTNHAPKPVPDAISQVKAQRAYGEWSEPKVEKTRLEFEVQS